MFYVGNGGDFLLVPGKFIGGTAEQAGRANHGGLVDRGGRDSDRK